MKGYMSPIHFTKISTTNCSVGKSVSALKKKMMNKENSVKALALV